MQREIALRNRMKTAVGIHYIGHRLGQAAHSERWLRARIDWLVETQGFPHHLPSPKPNERVYNAAAVDAWFDNQPGAVAAATVQAVDRKAWATVLDARAASLR